MNTSIISSPSFEKVLVFTYFDGALTGLASAPDGCVCFSMVAWDADQNERLFALSPVPASVFDEAWRAYAVVEDPREPYWLPNSSTQESEQIAARALASLENVCALATGSDVSTLQEFVPVDDEFQLSISRLAMSQQWLDVSNQPLLPSFLQELRARSTPDD
jgi:hypothetical protein